MILFGSRARGEGRPDSDLDLLVIEPELKSRRAEFAEAWSTRRCTGGVSLPERDPSAEAEFPFDVPEVVALTEHAVPLRYDEILDTEPLDRRVTVALVDGIGGWAEALLR